MELMKRIRNYWKMLTHIGTEPSISYMEYKRTHMVNLIALVCIVPTVYFAIINLFEERTVLAMINFSNTLCSLSVLVLHKYGKHHYAKFMLLASNFVFFFAGALLYRNGAEYFLVCILIAAMLLYDNRRVHIGFGLAVTAAIAVIYVYPVINDFEQPVPAFRVVFNIVCSLIFIVVTVNFFLKIIYSNMKKIEHQRLTLQAINRDKEKIFSIIAHDIKSPFATLETMVVALEEQVLNNATSPEFIRQLHLRIVQQNRVLDDLLQWGSSSLKGVASPPRSITIGPIINDILAAFGEQIDLKQLKIDVTIHKDEQVFVNRDHLIIILRNLISNAIKFSYVAGKINIFTSTDQNLTFVHIKDQGIGIHPSKSALLFDVIQRKSLGTVDEPGAGLGLVLCKDLIKRNNGVVHLNSTPNVGSIFTVGLPSAARQADNLTTENIKVKKINVPPKPLEKSLEVDSL